MARSLPLAERRRLAQMVARHQVPLIEDVLYNDLCEDDDRRRAVQSFDTGGQVMLCGSFSKTIAPGLRLGWIASPGQGERQQRLQRMKAATSGSETVMLQRALADLLTQPGIEAGYRQLRAVVAARMDEARAEFTRLVQQFPEDDDLRLSLALICMESQDWLAASAYFSELIGRNAHLDTAHFNLGRAYEQRKEPDNALHEYAEHIVPM